MAFFVELGRQLATVQELSATEGVQSLQNCMMAAAQRTYQKTKSANYQPKDKPLFNDECRVALRQYEDALQDAISHVAKYSLKRVRAVVQRKKRHHTKHTSAKLIDFAKHSPAVFWKRFWKKGKSVPIPDETSGWLTLKSCCMCLGQIFTWTLTCLMFAPQTNPALLY